MKNLYTALGADNINKQILIIGFNNNKEQLKLDLETRLKTEECKDIVYTKIVDISTNNNALSIELVNWLKSIGIPINKCRKQAAIILQAIIEVCK